MSEWDRIPTVFAKTTAPPPYAYIKKNTPTSFPNLDKPAARGRKHHPPSVYPAEWPRAAHFNFPVLTSYRGSWPSDLSINHCADCRDIKKKFTNTRKCTLVFSITIGTHIRLCTCTHFLFFMDRCMHDCFRQESSLQFLRYF